MSDSGTPDASEPTATDETSGVPWRSPIVQVVLTSTLLAPLGVPLVSPALPVVRDAFGITDAEASLLVSTYFLTGIVLSPFIGVLADRVGRRRVLVACLSVFSLAGAPLALAPDYPTVLAIRVVQGTAAAGIFIATVTLVGDAFEGVRRNAVLGANTAALSVGAAVYPLVGGALATVAWNAPFLAYLAGLPVALFAWRTLTEPPSERDVRGLAYVRGAAVAVATPVTGALYAATFVTELLLFGAVFTALPFLLAANYGLSPLFIGLTVTAAEVASTVAAYGNGRLARRASNGHLVAAGFGCYGAGFLGAWLAPTPALVGAAMLAAGAGFGLIAPSVDAELSGLVAGRFRAGALSLRNSATFLGRAAGPVLFAGVAASTGYRVLLLAAGLIALAAAAIGIALAGLRPGERATPPVGERGRG